MADEITIGAATGSPWSGCGDLIVSTTRADVILASLGRRSDADTIRLLSESAGSAAVAVVELARRSHKQIELDPSVSDPRCSHRARRAAPAHVRGWDQRLGERAAVAGYACARR
jgi:hypothetical protein